MDAWQLLVAGMSGMIVVLLSGIVGFYVRKVSMVNGLKERLDSIESSIKIINHDLSRIAQALEVHARKLEELAREHNGLKTLVSMQQEELKRLRSTVERLETSISSLREELASLRARRGEH